MFYIKSNAGIKEEYILDTLLRQKMNKTGFNFKMCFFKQK